MKTITKKIIETNENKNNELSKSQEILDYSFKMFLIDVLVKKKEINDMEYLKIKEILKKEHFDYLNKQY